MSFHDDPYYKVYRDVKKAYILNGRGMESEEQLIECPLCGTENVCKADNIIKHITKSVRHHQLVQRLK